MAQGGQIAAQVLDQVRRRAQVGAALLDLEKLAILEIERRGARPSFLGYRGYEFATCLNVNEGIVHGLPNGYRLKNGDLLKIDLGIFFQGFHTDTALSIVVGKRTEFQERFLRAGQGALKNALAGCQVAGCVGDLSAAMQTTVEAAGFNVVRDLVGHGVGRKLHEPPQIPCYGGNGSGRVLEAGMTLAVEVIYCAGNPDLRVLEDGWTMITKDGSLAGLFEHTVAVTASGPRVLTASNAAEAESNGA